MGKIKYYAVREGRKNGVFKSWAECSKQIHGYSGALYKSFKTEREANEYLEQTDIVNSIKHNSEESIIEELNSNEMVVYVDGSNLGDGSKFSWGAIIFSKEGKHCISGNSGDKRFIQYRNISGELFATVHAINYAYKSRMKKVVIYHDYSGIRHWALGEWRTKNELSRYYKSYIDSMKNKIEIEFIKVKGHTGDKFNEEADILAKAELGI